MQMLLLHDIGITICMQATQSLEQSLRLLIVDLCRVLHSHGYQEISVGALMRVIGVEESRACEHDTVLIDLTEHFATPGWQHSNQEVPPNTTFH